MTINGQLKDVVDNRGNIINLGNFKRDRIDEAQAEEISDKIVTLNKREVLIDVISQYKTQLIFFSILLFIFASIYSVIYARRLRIKKTIDNTLLANEVTQMTSYLSL
ncbi:hypothetical protein BCR32DRAFT_107357 [Anaeromyces robustus]|uniref:Uncharacterized protein n=1 Tax=Anaeromyces robustus TaxID=1754192 RepID=A0A1Y1W686_9FUNG|nr:hypothetical protein BCR32DRAFT_107357 [Anaeromyces robustus]|eukprot:ORX68895.1 hypothetical protein BCR32DRAFT_107357 [Anaeromyces robustus]